MTLIYSVFKILYEINELDRQIDGTRTVTQMKANRPMCFHLS